MQATYKRKTKAGAENGSNAGNKRKKTNASVQNGANAKETNAGM